MATDRKAALDARFKANAAQRQADKERRRAEQAANSDPAESSAMFWSTFNAEVAAIQDDISVAVKASRAMGDAEKRDMMPGKVEAWITRLKQLQKQSSDAAMFLAKYDVRQAEARIKTVREKLDEARSTLVPRRKFTFRRRRKQPASSKAEEAPAGGADEAKEAADSCAKFEAPEKSFERQVGKTLVVRPGELCGGDAAASVDFRLTHLEDCTVFVCDVTRALHVDNLKRCRVFTGPIAGSVLMEGCQDCTFYFAARQIRLHTSTRCDFFLHVLSRPIIEHCDQLRFGLYNVAYPQLADQLAAAELDKPRAKTMWQEVDDFGWHRAQHSPNWSLVRDDDRVDSFPEGSTHVVGDLSLSFTAAAPADATATPAASPAPASAPAPTAAAPDVPAQDDQDDDDDEL